MPINNLTAKEADEASRLNQQRRWSLRRLLIVDEEKVQGNDQAVIEHIRSATSPDQYDTLLANKAVNALFCRGVLHFGGTP